VKLRPRHEQITSGAIPESSLSFWQNRVPHFHGSSANSSELNSVKLRRQTIQVWPPASRCPRANFLDASMRELARDPIKRSSVPHAIHSKRGCGPPWSSAGIPCRTLRDIPRAKAPIHANWFSVFSPTSAEIRTAHGKARDGARAAVLNHQIFAFDARDHSLSNASRIYRSFAPSRRGRGIRRSGSQTPAT